MDFFFSKKRKAIVKRESHQKDGVITKRQRMLYDGNDRDDTEFAKEVAGSLGAFSTQINGLWRIWSSNYDRRSYWWNSCKIKYTYEQTVRNKMIQDFEKIRAHDRYKSKRCRLTLRSSIEIHKSTKDWSLNAMNL
jgi:hypothetical protein